jgi:histidyl-tRNA synthetase
MAMAWMILAELGLSASLEINSLACPACRPDFNQALLTFLENCQGSLCEDCERRRQKNPLRVLDCKNPKCQEQYVNAPSILDHLCQVCDEHFKATESYLKALDIPYKVNSFMVRGLDYYTKTTFELLTDNLGAQSAIGAGGRYDGLIKQLGGPDLPGIGFAMGMERLVLLLQQKEEQPSGAAPDLFIAALGDEALQTAFSMCHALRRHGRTVLMDYAGRSLKNQMKQSGKNNCRFTLIVGADELAKGQATLRDMQSGTQEEIALSDDVSSWAEDLLARL